MPVVPENRVSSTQKKAPWVKDSASSSQQQGADIPWRKHSATKNPDTSPNPGNKATEKSSNTTEKSGGDEKALKSKGPVTKNSTTADKDSGTKPNTKKSTATKAEEVSKPSSATKSINDKSFTMSKKPPQAPTPPPPPGPPAPPPPPPPNLSGKPPVETLKNPAQLARLEQLKKGPRRRPDWGTMMKEIEQGKKLKKVECNDRSKPIIPRMKSLGKFVFDSEAKPASKSDAIHNKLLTEIQHGVKLKKVQCNDRSKPLLSGLRKFRRQLTIEEQKKGGEDVVEPLPELLLDETDDIDALRDDLQSAKQMLELELEAKAKLGKENRDLQCQVIAIEAENEKLKAQLGLIPESQVSALIRRDSRAFKDLKKSRSGLYKSSSGIKKSKSGFGDPKIRGMQEEDLGELNELEEEVSALKGQVLLIRNTAQEWEAKFREASQKLLLAQGNLEDSEQKRIMLEKKLELMQTRKGVSALVTQEKSVQTEEVGQRRVSRQSGDSFSQLSESEEEVDSDLELDDATILKKKQERELKLWENKLKSVKEKQVNCKTERKNLKGEQKNLEQELKDGKLRLKDLQKEVDKMANLLKTDETKADDEEESEDESEEESEESSSEDEEEEESASEESEESSDSSAQEAETHEEQLNILTNHVKRGENILNALRKGNYLLRANIDHLKDDLECVRIKYHDLEHELNIVLADV